MGKVSPKAIEERKKSQAKARRINEVKRRGMRMRGEV
jgi:hypothetical protein